MVSPKLEEFVRVAEEIYSQRLRSILEHDHLNEFVAIEPESGEYFLGKTLSEATKSARKHYPNRLTHAMRIGHKTAIHFGMQLR